MNWWYINTGIFALSSLLFCVIYVIVMSLSVLRTVLEFVLLLCTCAFYFSFFLSQHDLAVRLSKLIVSLLSDLILPLKSCVIPPWAFFLSLPWFPYLPFIEVLWILWMFKITLYYEKVPPFFGWYLHKIFIFALLQSCQFSRGNNCDCFVSPFQSKNDCSWCKIYSACYEQLK